MFAQPVGATFTEYTISDECAQEKHSGKLGRLPADNQQRAQASEEIAL